MREQIRLIKIDLFKEESKSRKKIENQGRYFFQQKKTWQQRRWNKYFLKQFLQISLEQVKEYINESVLEKMMMNYIEY